MNHFFIVSWGERKEEKEKMKTWQALKAADEGKKIRRRWWAANMYSFKDESRFWFACGIIYMVFMAFISYGKEKDC